MLFLPTYTIYAVLSVSSLLFLHAQSRVSINFRREESKGLCILKVCPIQDTYQLETVNMEELE